jgi:hydrogenase maturation protein HypF
MMRAGRRIEIHGIVQGVGFRPWVYRVACEEGVAGRVRNDASGVTIEAFGTERALQEFMRRLAAPPPAADVHDIQTTAIPDEPVAGFKITSSATEGTRRVAIPADLATCSECVDEIFDPTNRRFRYAFTNCTNCGPRFTITRDAPYDRPATTMADFTMCPRCQREYEDPVDRRFHAQPNACPHCGPRLVLVTAQGTVLDPVDPIQAAAAALADGLVVGIKGLGGFHLACDATDAAVVRTLRLRKRRDEKPFAVMVRDEQAAEELAVLTDAERTLLTSVERPVVIASRRCGARLAAEVAPNNSLVGLMLPYTPLHHLLLHDAARPLVMTSANYSDEPIVFENDEALEHLAAIVDLMLLHDRRIETRCDDSIARMIAGRPVLLRRSRGYVPRAIAVDPALPVPVLACGALLKNTFCIAARDSAVLGPHIGDLDNLATYQSYGESIERMSRFLDVTPEVVAYDLHPDYMSTRYALARPEGIKIAVQHHHAHIASAMAEHRLMGQVIGVAYDGTGFGTDGSAWGGEIMVAGYEACHRVATLRPIPLAGGDAAIRNPWRIAVALLDDAFDGRAPLEAFSLFDARPFCELSTVRRMVTQRIHSPLAHGAGRYFDGIGALALARPSARFEGQIALEWNVIADPVEQGRYGFEIDDSTSPWTIDLRPMVEKIVRELLLKTPASIVSARFHNTLVAATAEAVRRAVRSAGLLPVVLTGGCFQNARLAEGLAAELTKDCTVYLHNRVPPGDGGIALGQAVIGAAMARRQME